MKQFGKKTIEVGQPAAPLTNPSVQNYRIGLFFALTYIRKTGDRPRLLFNHGLSPTTPITLFLLFWSRPGGPSYLKDKGKTGDRPRLLLNQKTGDRPRLLLNHGLSPTTPIALFLSFWSRPGGPSYLKDKAY